MIIWVRGNKDVNEGMGSEGEGEKQVNGRLCSENQRDLAINWMEIREYWKRGATYDSKL